MLERVQPAGYRFVGDYTENGGILMRILICGDRYWVDKDLIKIKLYDIVKDYEDLVTKNITIIHGNAPGADILGKQAALDLGIPEENILSFPADWKTHGRAAGPIRNKQMLSEGKPDIVLAFHDDIGRPNCGTLDMIKQANKAGVNVRLYAR